MLIAAELFCLCSSVEGNFQTQKKAKKIASFLGNMWFCY